MGSTFDSWRMGELDKIFGLSELEPDFPPLLEWMDAGAQGCEINDYERALIADIQHELILEASYWNEDELKFHFIGPLMRTARFVELHKKGIRSFTQRPLKATLQGVNGPVDVNGVVDFVLASGKDAPDTPYFFLHEYKPEEKHPVGPRGQLVVAMLAAQTQNENPQQPVFGCYLVGRLWFFCILIGKEYAFSRGYNTDNGQIVQIIAILRKIKDYVFGFQK